ESLAVGGNRLLGKRQLGAHELELSGSPAGLVLEQRFEILLCALERRRVVFERRVEVGPASQSDERPWVQLERLPESGAGLLSIVGVAGAAVERSRGVSPVRQRERLDRVEDPVRERFPAFFGGRLALMID